MKDIIINIYLKILDITHPYKWDSGKTNILIYEPDEERNFSFQKRITDNFPTNDAFDFKFVSKKRNLIGYSPFADIIYCYGISKFLTINRAKIIYVGIVGYNNYKPLTGDGVIITPQNFASPYIADFVLATLISFERGLHNAGVLKRMKKWNQKPFFGKEIKSVSELKIGILGLGNIGGRVASHLYKLGCEIHGFDPQVTNSTFIHYSYDQHNWVEMLKTVDYFIIAIPYNEANHWIIDKSKFELMHKNLCLVNVSRGCVINEKMMEKALQTKMIRGAILDTFESEPLLRNSKLWKLPNVIITPHISGNIQLVYPLIQNDFLEKISSIGHD